MTTRRGSTYNILEGINQLDVVLLELRLDTGPVVCDFCLLISIREALEVQSAEGRVLGLGWQRGGDRHHGQQEEGVIKLESRGLSFLCSMDVVDARMSSQWSRDQFCEIRVSQVD